ncbi:MAG TPA: ABC transporter ATP-binding protein [Symbiobacteriaceae bacterium]|nr:ABC transporter ATP-binding protein [Symbiobacteriaceae bacterium]
MSDLITVRNVSRTYRSEGTEHPAVRGVSFAVAEGEFVALMGPSGCGKSTLLNMLSGVDTPDAGEVWVAGRRIDNLSETQLALFRRRHVGIVFQFFNLIHNLDVRGNIELPALLAGMPQAQIRTRTQELLESLSMADLGGKLPGQLSGGQRQRVAVARALINRPAVLLADEPTGALDQESGAAVLRLFRSLHSQGQTILMVTHDPKVSGHAGRILMMEDGRVVEEMRPAAQSASRLAARLLGRKEQCE